MKHKVLEKARRFPGAIDVMRIAHARDLRDFDDAYTAPMHGFRNALDNWTRASSKPGLARVAVPTPGLDAGNRTAGRRCGAEWVAPLWLRGGRVSYKQQQAH